MKLLKAKRLEPVFDWSPFTCRFLTLKKIIELSLDGLTSFSVKPLQMANYAGVILTTFGFSYLMAMIFLKIFTSTVIAGWNLLISLQLMLTGVLLTMMGIIGEYIGRIYDEARERPLYIVSECYGMIKNERIRKKEQTV